MDMKMKRYFFNLAQSCIAPLIQETSNNETLAELNEIKTTIDTYQNYMSFQTTSTSQNQELFFELVKKHHDQLKLSFKI